MATDPSGEIRQFYDFVGKQIGSGEPLTPEDVLELWRVEHPLQVGFDDDEQLIADVQEALDDIGAGRTGKPAAEFFMEFRQRNGIE